MIKASSTHRKLASSDESATRMFSSTGETQVFAQPAKKATAPLRPNPRQTPAWAAEDTTAPRAPAPAYVAENDTQPVPFSQPAHLPIAEHAAAEEPEETICFDPPKANTGSTTKDPADDATQYFATTPSKSDEREETQYFGNPREVTNPEENTQPVVAPCRKTESDTPHDDPPAGTKK